MDGSGKQLKYTNKRRYNYSTMYRPNAPTSAAAVNIRVSKPDFSLLMYTGMVLSGMVHACMVLYIIPCLFVYFACMLATGILFLLRLFHELSVVHPLAHIIADDYEFYMFVRFAKYQNGVQQN